MLFGDNFYDLKALNLLTKFGNDMVSMDESDIEHVSKEEEEIWKLKIAINKYNL